MHDSEEANRKDQLGTSLRRSLKLSPYESRAYLTLIANGELTPSRLASLGRIPRPRAYDVAKGLVEKGLVTERLGRPLSYSTLNPRNGLPGLLARLEEDEERGAEERDKAVKRLTTELERFYDEARRASQNEEEVVVGSSSRAVWRQLESLKERTKNEFLGVSISAACPPLEIFALEERMLSSGITMKLIRPFPDSLRRPYVKLYSQLIKKGFEMRSSERADFSFDVSDSSGAVLWLNESVDRPSTEVVWLYHKPIARLLKDHFERLWQSADPVESRLEKMLLS